jgi:hypothetical protein
MPEIQRRIAEIHHRDGDAFEFRVAN